MAYLHNAHGFKSLKLRFIYESMRNGYITLKYLYAHVLLMQFPTSVYIKNIIFQIIIISVY